MPVTHNVHPPGEADDALDRVVVFLPKWQIAELDAHVRPGRSRSSVCRDMLTAAIRGPHTWTQEQAS